MNVKIYGLVLGLWGMLFTWAADDVKPMKAVIRLKDGSSLTGRHESAAGDGLGIRPYWSADPLEIPLPSISRFSQENVPKRLMREGALLYFRNTGRLQVEGLAFDGKGFSGTSAWGEKIVIPERALDHIRFFDAANVRYTGPELTTKLGGRNRFWKSGEIEWPEKFLLEVLVEKSTEDLVYQMTLLEDIQSGGAVMMSRRLVLEFADRNINAAWYQVVNRNQIKSNNWRGQLPEASHLQRIQIYGDFATQTFSLYVNERKIKSWASDSGQTAAPTVPLPVTFRLSSEGELEIRSMRVMKWEGPALSEVELETGFAKSGWIYFHNGEVKQGQLLAIDQQGITWAHPAEAAPQVYPRGEVLMLRRPRVSLSDSFPATEGEVQLRTAGVEDYLRMKIDRISGGRIQQVDWQGEEMPAFSIPLQAVNTFWRDEEVSP